MENGFNALRDIAPGTATDFQEEVSFAQGVKASLAYKYVPLVDYISEVSTFPDQPQDGYRARDNISDDMLPYANTLLRATSPEHMEYLQGTVRKGIKTRETLESAGLATQFAAELFDPVNYIGIPFVKAGSFGYRALRGGTATGAVSIGQEGLRDPFDPVGTQEETAMNIGASFVMGGLLTGLTTIPMQRRVQAQLDAEVELKRFEQSMAPADAEAPDASIASSMFTDSWLYNAVTTPMKRILQSKDIPNEVKLTTLKIANDSGVLLEMNRKGQKVGNSVYQNSKQFDGEWVALQADLLPLWGQSTGKGTITAFDYTVNRSGYERWLESIDVKAMKGIKPADAIETKVMESINAFYARWETRLSEQGLIGNKASMLRLIATREKRIDKVGKILERENIGQKFRDKLQRQLDRYLSEIEEARLNLEDITASEKAGVTVKPPNEKVFRPRYFDLKAISENRDAFETILKNWFKENPTIIRQSGAKFVKRTLDTDEKSLALRAKEATDNILGIKDLTDPEAAYYGIGRSKHFKHRALDIPNELILDFIQTNPLAVMRAYTQRVGTRYEFSRQFNGASIDDVLDDTFEQMIESGSSIEQALAAMKDMRALYKRVTGGILRDPDSWDQVGAKYLRDLATLNYLGKAGIATLTEPAKIMMEHGIGPTMRALFGVLRDNKLKMGARESMFGGEGIDNILNTSHMRMVDELNNNPFQSDIFDKMKVPFFILNGLGPITKLLKDIDAMVRCHTYIDYSVRWTQGKLSKQEQEYLLRYNIDYDTAKKISKMPWQKSEDGLYMANTEAWSNIDIKSVRKDVSKTYKPSNKSVFEMSEEQLLTRFSKEFYVDRIITDKDIVQGVFDRKGTPNILGHADGIGLESPATVYLNFDNIRSSYNKLKNREDLDTFKRQLDEALQSGRITESTHGHQMAYVNNIDLLESEDDFVRFVLMHELHHTTTPQRAGESIADYEKRIDQLAFSYMRNERQAGLDLAVDKEMAIRVADAENTVRDFRSSLSSGILNTILMGTPADKPIISDGIAYIPMRVAGKFGMKEDPEFTGYARIENGFLGLPFQFYSYSLASVNKVAAAYAHGQLKNQFIGTAIAMGLGYMVLDLKTPDFVDLSFQDKLARSFDYSGVAALYSDMMYTAMSTSLALGGPNLTGGILEPRFPQKPSKIDAITGITGAGTSTAADIGRGIVDIATGNIGKGTAELIDNAPMTGLFFIDGLFKAFGDMLENTIDDERMGGFKRY